MINPVGDHPEHDTVRSCFGQLPDLAVMARSKKPAEDIQASKPPIEMSLAKVGINELRVPISYKTKGGDPIRLETAISMYVNLTPETKGINMSRLPRTLYEYMDRDISTGLMEDILKDFRDKLQATDAYLKFRFNYPIKKRSLITEAYGWSYYPVEFEAKLIAPPETGQYAIVYTMMVSILYSSTCPCSKHLSDQLEQGLVIRNGESVLIQNLSPADRRRYESKDVISGTPHAQRSRADVKIRFSRDNSVWIEDVIETVEGVLKTPVQVIVKREDEQEFARLNANSTMFVEDAVRLMSDAIDKVPGVLDWSIVANHFESLHAHNAICVNWKGVPNGLR